MEISLLHSNITITNTSNTNHSNISLVLKKPCIQFSLDEILKSTDNFNESKCIRKGGFGSVYKGVVEDGSIVAVKRLVQESKQGIKEYFEMEIKILSKCQHSNLVRLVGYCNEHEEMILVYEYISNGTLADHLYKNMNSSLTWETRLKICIGVARGLNYLHSGIDLVDGITSHLYVKSENILLDENWVAKIGSGNQPTSHQYSSRKTDVYAFGVVLMEVLTRRCVGDMTISHPESSLYNWIHKHISKRTLYKIIDPTVVLDIEPTCLQIFANAASRSVDDDPNKRPSMTEMVAELESAMASQKDTNPSSSIVNYEDRHFNAIRTESQSEITSENISVHTEASSDYYSVSVEQEPEVSNSGFWSWMRNKYFAHERVIVLLVLNIIVSGITTVIVMKYNLL